MLRTEKKETIGLETSKKQQEIIFIIGGPGSGKGTQCEILQKSRGYCHISSGDLIRKLLSESKADAEMQSMRTAVKQGALLDSKMIVTLIKQEIAKYPDAPGFLIDGCPRTIDQIDLFEKEISPCNKIIYFNVSEKVMRERMLHRGETQGREDDNEKAITNRIKIYREQTLPVVNYFEQERRASFHKIDASRSIEEVSKSVRHVVADDKITKVNFLHFLQLYLSNGNFYKAIDELEKEHGTVNFEVVSYATMFYIIQNKKYVEKVLSAKTTLGYQYNNFNVSHGHHLNIIALQAFLEEKGNEKNPLWKNIHSGLAKSVGDRNLINTLINKHIHKLFSKPVFKLDVAFESFMLDVWCEYLFGPNISVEEYRKTREQLLAATHYAYYDSRLKALPYVGNLACRFYGYLQGDKFKKIDQDLRKFISQSDSGLMHRFRKQLQDSPTFPKDKIDQAVLDNTFDYVLVFDFIHNAMYESLAAMVKNELDKTEDRRSIYTNGLRNSFLFQYRSRVPQETIQLGSETIAKGVPTYLNLLESNLQHSYGPRSCVGAGVSNWIQEAIWDHLKDRELRLVQTTRPEERAKQSHSLDVPISPERYEVRWSYPKDYLQRILPDYKFNKVEHFYDVLKVFEKPAVVGYMVAAFVEKIEQLKIDKSELCIASPEMRGIPIAAMVAKELNIPFVTIRKPGKIPGPILSQKYSSAYASDTVEISMNSDIRKHVILVDDGIASGGTTLACCNLIEQRGGDVSAILAMINHTYKVKPEELNKYNVHTVFDFADISNANQLEVKESESVKLKAS